MKRSVRCAHLHIYHSAQGESPAGSRLFTQKNMDFALIVVSLAGFISAVVFLLT